MEVEAGGVEGAIGGMTVSGLEVAWHGVEGG